MEHGYILFSSYTSFASEELVIKGFEVFIERRSMFSYESIFLTRFESFIVYTRTYLD